MQALDVRVDVLEHLGKCREMDESGRIFVLDLDAQCVRVGSLARTRLLMPIMMQRLLFALLAAATHGFATNSVAGHVAARALPRQAPAFAARPPPLPTLTRRSTPFIMQEAAAAEEAREFAALDELKARCKSDFVAERCRRSRERCACLKAGRRTHGSPHPLSPKSRPAQ